MIYAIIVAVFVVGVRCGMWIERRLYAEQHAAYQQLLKHNGLK